MVQFEDAQMVDDDRGQENDGRAPRNKIVQVGVALRRREDSSFARQN